MYYKEGFWILGAVFLCTTGAEALYSDLGHCGRKNIRVSWGMVKIALLANYFGQGAWLLNHTGNTLNGARPFFALMPEWFLFAGIIIATSAAIVASQALISGTFTVVNEGMRLNFLPKGRVEYPTDFRGQIYIPSINWLLCAACIGIVLFFQKSSNMEAAYGFSHHLDDDDDHHLVKLLSVPEKVSEIFYLFSDHHSFHRGSFFFNSQPEQIFTRWLCNIDYCIAHLFNDVGMVRSTKN
jgi:hypothetical protein